jgi:hypothetical protein
MKTSITREGSSTSISPEPSGKLAFYNEFTSFLACELCEFRTGTALNLKPSLQYEFKGNNMYIQNVTLFYQNVQISYLKFLFSYKVSLEVAFKVRSRHITRSKLRGAPTLMTEDLRFSLRRL